MKYLLFSGDPTSDCGVEVSGFEKGFDTLADAMQYFNSDENLKGGIGFILVLDNMEYVTSYQKLCGYSDFPVGSHPREWHEHKHLKWGENQ